MSSWPTIIAICTLFVCIAKTTVGSDVESEPKSMDNLCLTPQCIYAATRILRRMNSRVKPCDDFYEFVCGNYAQSATIPDGKTMIIPRYEKEEETVSRLQRIIEDIDETLAPKRFSDLKKMYEKCIADELSILDEPTDNPWQNNVFEAQNRWYFLHKDRWNGAQYDDSAVGSLIFRFDTKPFVHNPKISVWELALNDVAIPWSFIRIYSEPMIQAYYNYMTNVVSHLADDDLEVAMQLPKILSFDMQLATILFPEYETYENSYQYHTMTVGELDRKFPSWKLKEQTFEIHDSDKIQIPWDLKALETLQEWISKKQSTRDFDYWVEWRLTDYMSDRLDPFVSHEKQLLKDTISGTRTTNSVKHKCVEEVRKNSPFLLNVLYYGQYLNYNAIKDSNEILKNVQQQHAILISQAEWLDDKIKRYAFQKVKEIRNNIGIFEKFMIDQNSKRSDYEPRLSNGFLADNRANLSKILTHLNPSSEERHNFINGYAKYSYESQHISVGAVTYTDAYYDVDQPRALNYGALGSVLGAELAHSLDNKGRHYLKNGNVEIWWDSKSDEIFVNRTTCLVKMYRKYTLNEFGIHINSLKPRNDDIADNLGTRAAYFAYTKSSWLKGFGNELPGLDYSPKQLFWISLATTQCARYRPEYSMYGAQADEHTFSKIRVNAPLSNVKEFSNDFKCSPDSKMNPVKKCSIW